MRRRFGIFLAIVLVAISMASCGNSQDNTSDTKKETTNSAETTKTQDTETENVSSDLDLSKVKIGAFTSNNKDDGGWSQAQYTGLSGAVENLGLSDDQFLFIEDIPEEGNSDAAAVVQQLVDDGCNIIMAVSSGYKDAIDSIAPQYPDIQFVQFNGNVADNAIGYGIRDYQAMFLCGYISALMSEKNELGYSAGYPEASVIRGINAFAQGAKYANPDATVQVAWANSWYDPAAEKECANSLIATGITCLGINASSPAIPQACEEAGGYCTGYHVDMKDYAPKAVMTSFMWNWTPIFEDIITRFAQGGEVPFGEKYFWGADKGCAQISEINMDIVPQDVADKVLETQEKVISGEIDVFGGELKDNEGNVIVPEGETMSDEMILDMGCLVENVIGTLP